MARIDTGQTISVDPGPAATRVPSRRTDPDSGSWACSWQRLVVVALVLIIYSNLPRFLFDRGIGGIPPALVTLSFSAAVFPLLLMRASTGRILRSPLMLWGIAYLCLVQSSFFWGDQSEVAVGGVFRAWLSVASLMVFRLALDGEGATALARRAVVVVTLLAVGINLFEVLHPGVFSNFPGRSAGLYMNPNISGSAIVYGLVLGLEAIPPRARPWYALVTGLGVLATLSRTAIIVWTLVTGVLFLSGALRATWRTYLAGAAIILLIFVALPSGTVARGFALVEFLGGGKVGRLGIGGTDQFLGGASVASRSEVAREAWRLFQDRPLLGHGPGATREMGEDQSTHNMYLKFLAEQGLLGFLLYPGALIAALWGIPRSRRAFTVAFSLAWMLYGLVSHNEFELPHIVLALALAAAIAGDGRCAPSAFLRGTPRPARPGPIVTPADVAPDG